MIELGSISNKDPHIWFPIPLWFRETVFSVIDFLNYFEIRIISVEAHFVNWIVLPAPIVELCRKQNDVLRSDSAVGMVGHILFIEGLAPLPTLQEESVDILVQISRLYSTDNLF